MGHSDRRGCPVEVGGLLWSRPELVCRGSRRSTQDLGGGLSGRASQNRSDCYRPRSHVAVATPRRHVVKAKRCAWPIHRDDTTSMRLSDFARPEYQKVLRPTAASGGAPPGLITRTSTIVPMMRTIPTSVAGSTMLELEASLADASGPEADCEPVPPNVFPGGVLGNAALP